MKLIKYGILLILFLALIHPCLAKDENLDYHRFTPGSIHSVFGCNITMVNANNEDTNNDGIIDSREAILKINYGNNDYDIDLKLGDIKEFGENDEFDISFTKYLEEKGVGYYVIATARDPTPAILSSYNVNQLTKEKYNIEMTFKNVGSLNAEGFKVTATGGSTFKISTKNLIDNETLTVNEEIKDSTKVTFKNPDHGNGTLKIKIKYHYTGNTKQYTEVVNIPAVIPVIEAPVKQTEVETPSEPNPESDPEIDPANHRVGSLNELPDPEVAMETLESPEQTEITEVTGSEKPFEKNEPDDPEPVVTPAPVQTPVQTPANPVQPEEEKGFFGKIIDWLFSWG